MLNSIDLAVKNNIPCSKPMNNNIVKLGWSDYVKPFQDDAKFWFSIWVSMGKPLNCQIFFVMKNTRNKFHYVVRRLKSINSQNNENKMLNSFLDGKASNLISELKSQRS